MCRCPPPKSRFFRFDIQNFQNVITSGRSRRPPPPRGRHPPTGNPGSATVFGSQMPCQATPSFVKCQLSVADPGFPVGGRGPRRRGRGLPRWLHFENFVCQNERIWTLGGVCRARPLDPPMDMLIDNLEASNGRMQKSA